MNKQIKSTSNKNQKIAYERCNWNYSHGCYGYTDIYDAYKSPSIYKVRAWNNCKDLCKKLNGFDLIISSANSQTFSVMFKYLERGTKKLCYAYITKDYNRFCYA